MEALSVAIVGAAGLVGQEILRLLRARQFPLGTVRLLGSHRSAGKPVEDEGDPNAKVALLSASSFDGVDLAFFAGGPALSTEYVPIAARSGAAVVDLSSRFRLDPEVPLVVPEVNADAIGAWRERGFVANPSSTAIALTVALAPLAAEAGLRRVVVSTYQGVATAGRRAVNGLSRETLDLLNGRGMRRTRFARRIAFNCVPQVGDIEPGGASLHELSVAEETRRILELPDLAMQVTAVRVPMFFGMGLSVLVETEQPLAADDASALLRQAAGLLVHETVADAYPTPVEVTGSEATHVGRVRTDTSSENGLALWIALDNLGKGAALNAVQVAEILIRDHL